MKGLAMDRDTKYIVGYTGIILLVLGLIILQGMGIGWGAAGAPLIEERPGQTVTGRVKTLRLAVNSAVTLSGVSQEGVFITGASNPARAVTAGITIYVQSPFVGQNVFFYNENDTSLSGDTLYIHFINTGTSIYSDTPCIAGVSKYILSGTTLAKTIAMWASQVSKWTIKTVGTPTVDWD